jgi:hypothetical protein
MRLFADSAPAYTAKMAQRLLAEFRFLADWPPYSLDLNLLAFANRRILQAKVHAAASHKSERPTSVYRRGI